MLDKLFKDFKHGASLYHVWLYQSYHEISAKYKRTFLGSLWIAGSMVATSLSLAIIFGGIFGQSLQEALPYIMGGILSFGLGGYILYEAPEMFMASGSIIKNHAYPFTYYAFQTASRALLLFLHNLVVYLIFMALLGTFVIPHWTIVPGIALVLVAMLSWGMLTGMLASRFRDMRFLLPYMGQLFSMITPIFWRVDNLSGWRTYLVHYNPFYGLVEIVRSPLLGHAAPLEAWTIAGITAASGIVMWLIFFSAFRRRIPFWI